MASNYYAFRDAKVVIAMELIKRGWKIFGWKDDESDSMTDYWSPASWNGIATKDGYTLVIDCDDYMVRTRSGREIKKRNNEESVVMSEKTRKLIERLQEVRVDRGATESEERTAKEKIRILMAKMENNNLMVIVDHFPTFQVNPPRASWHVEKDGTIIAKGNGIAKFADLKWFNAEECRREMELYPETHYRYRDAEQKLKTGKALEKFLNKLDSAAGCYIGGSGKNKGKAFTYVNVKTIEYKVENHAHECAGKVQEGQCFIVKGYFTGGITHGGVYRIHKVNDKYYTAVKMNKKLTKELTGRSNSGNHFGWLSAEKLESWVSSGALAFCEIKEVKTPYTVEKCVKKAI